MRVIDFVNQGGSIMWVLVFLNIIGLSLIFWRLFVIKDFKKKVDIEAQSIYERWKKIARTETEIVKDMVSKRVHDLEFGMNAVRVIATIAPLLGLLGTVVGIYEAFQVISSQGLSNPALFAEGISYALITTIGGLIVAIPHYIAHNFLSGQLDDLEMRLEEATWPLIKA